MQEKYNKNHISLRIAAILFILTMFSFCINSGLYASYSTNSDTQDSARIAVFSVKPDESYTTAAIEFSEMAPGETIDYYFTVSSDSDVSLKCFVSLSTTENLPLSFTINDNIALDSNGESVEAVTLSPHQSGVTLKLTASWPSGENNIAYLSEIDAVRLTFTSVQVD